MKEYYSVYRLAVSGPDVLLAVNLTPGMAYVFRRYPDTYRVEKQSERIDY